MIWLAAFLAIPCLLCVVQPLFKLAGSSTATLTNVSVLGTALKQSSKYMQRIGVIASFNIAWPGLVKEFFALLGSMAFNVDNTMHIGCVQEKQTRGAPSGWLINGIAI